MNKTKGLATTAAMLGKGHRFGCCGCCTDDTKTRSRRASRRRESQALRKALRSPSAY